MSFRISNLSSRQTACCELEDQPRYEASYATVIMATRAEMDSTVLGRVESYVDMELQSDVRAERMISVAVRADTEKHAHQ